MTQSSRIKGFLLALVSSCTFGMIPLFAKPCLDAGIGTYTTLTCRFIIACLCMLPIAIRSNSTMRVSVTEFFQISLLAFMYSASGVTMFWGYAYLPSGVATTVQFSYPVFTPIIMFLFMGERINMRTVVAIVLAVVGVMLLSGIGDDTGVIRPQGIVLELLAGLTYAIYLVLMPSMRVGRIESTKLTFYIFFQAAIMMGVMAVASGDTLALPYDNYRVMANLALLGLVPTTLSNITLTMSLKHISSTLVAVLGALEPLTAMLIGIGLLGEPFTIVIGLGFLAIIMAVSLLVLEK